MANFSTAANTFSVVGLADVVCRATAELYVLVKRASSASNSATQLLKAVQGLTAVVAEVRIWTAEYEQSLSVQEDGQCISNNIMTALETYGEQVGELAQRLADVRNARKDWFQRIKGRFIFALNEDQIQHSLQIVTYHQMTLKG